MFRICSANVRGPLTYDEGEKARWRKLSFSQGRSMPRDALVEDLADRRRVPAVEVEDAFRHSTGWLSEEPYGATYLAVM